MRLLLLAAVALLSLANGANGNFKMREKLSNFVSLLLAIPW